LDRRLSDAGSARRRSNGSDFLVSTQYGRPVQDWFAMSNADTLETSSIYLAVLSKGLPSPLAKESDEEGARRRRRQEIRTTKVGRQESRRRGHAGEDRLDGLSQRSRGANGDGGYSDLSVGKTARSIT